MIPIHPNEIRIITPTTEYTYTPHTTEPTQPPMEYRLTIGWIL